MKTSELTGAQLDWAVAKCENLDPIIRGKDIYTVTTRWYSPSNDWSQAGPIIERETIQIGWVIDHWEANKVNDYRKGFHGTDSQHPLIAAMRCFVASMLGDEVEVPKELK